MTVLQAGVSTQMGNPLDILVCITINSATTMAVDIIVERAQTEAAQGNFQCRTSQDITRNVEEPFSTAGRGHELGHSLSLERQ